MENFIFFADELSLLKFISFATHQSSCGNMGTESPLKKSSFQKDLPVKQTLEELITFTESTWITLLGLVDVFEIFLPVTQTTVWQ